MQKTCRLVFTGLDNPDSVKHLVAAAAQLGFTLDQLSDPQLLKRSGWTPTEKQRIDLVDLLRADNPHLPRRARDKLVEFVGCVDGRTIAHLEKLSFDEFLAIHHRLQRGTDWGSEALILKAMIAYHLRFTDFDPEHALTPLQSLELNNRIVNRLEEDGVLWVQLLCRLSETEVLGIRTFGPPTLTVLKERLAKDGLCLYQE